MISVAAVGGFAQGDHGGDPFVAPNVVRAGSVATTER
jgi:hypothetical protein